MTYKYLEDIARNHQLPLSAIDDQGNRIEIDKDDSCYRVVTFQNNDWVRINCYYCDGSVDEEYTKLAK